MNRIEKKFLTEGHHAYCITGSTSKVRDSLFEALKNEWSVETQGNPDFVHSKHSYMGVDDARKLTENQKNRSFSGGKKIFVIEADSIAREAQNALLKVLEEPSEDSIFFVIGNATKNLLPTILSRLFTIDFLDEADDEDPLAISFMKSSVAERMTIIKKLMDDIKSEKRGKADALSIIHVIEQELMKKHKIDKKISISPLAEIEMCRNYMSDRSAGIKMLLEYVALITPVLK